jgi:hypothetical protein
MAKAKLNPAFESISGPMDKMTLATTKEGETIMKKKPWRRKPRTANEKKVNQRFTCATAFAKAMVEDSVTKSFYESLPRRSFTGAYQVALRDFYHAPVVDAILVEKYTGKLGDIIGVEAHDDSGVNAVTIAVLDMNGGVLEEGPAHCSGANSHWEYAAQRDLAADQTVSIRATATDRPGNIGSKSCLAYFR